MKKALISGVAGQDGSSWLNIYSRKATKSTESARGLISENMKFLPRV